MSIIGRNGDKAVAAAARIVDAGGQARGHAADVRNMAQLQTVVDNAAALIGPVDICIAGAAGNFVAEAMGMSRNGFRTVVEIDLIGTYQLFRGIADLALFLVSGAAAYINGTVIAIDGGQSNLGSLPFGSMLLDSRTASLLH